MEALIINYIHSWSAVEYNDRSLVLYPVPYRYNAEGYGTYKYANPILHRLLEADFHTIAKDSLDKRQKITVMSFTTEMDDEELDWAFEKLKTWILLEVLKLPC